MANNIDLHKWVVRKLEIDEDPEAISEKNVSFNQPSTFRAGILSLLIKERSIMEVIPYRIVTEIHENLEGTFVKFDINNDGHIDKDEMKKVFHEMDIFEKYDKTGDGTINHTELRDLLIEAGVGEAE